MLTIPQMVPNGILTIKVDAFVNFTCTSKSIPKSSIEWHISGSKLTNVVAISSPLEDTIISTLSHQVKKEQHNENIFCSANDLFTTMNSSTANLNILCK